MFREMIIAIYGFCMTMSFGMIYSYSNFFVPVGNQYGLNHGTDSTIPGVSLVMFSLGSILAGYLAQKIGFRKTAATGAILVGEGTMLSRMASSLVEILASFRFLASFGMAVVVLCADTLVVKWFVKKRAAAVSVVVAGAGVGIDVIALPYTESANITGGIHCSTCQLIREPGPLVQKLVGKSIDDITPGLS